jgi:hypothetical protein
MERCLIGVEFDLFRPQFVLCLEINLLLLNLLVVDSRKFVDDGSFTYTTWIVQELYFF